MQLTACILKKDPGMSRNHHVFPYVGCLICNVGDNIALVNKEDFLHRPLRSKCTQHDSADNIRNYAIAVI